MRVSELKAAIALIEAFANPAAQVALYEIAKRLRQELKQELAREARRARRPDDDKSDE